MLYATCIYVCNTHMRDLCDMYAQAQEHTVPKGECEHITQIMTVCYVHCSTSDTLKSVETYLLLYYLFI